MIELYPESTLGRPGKQYLLEGSRNQRNTPNSHADATLVLNVIGEYLGRFAWSLSHVGDKVDHDQLSTAVA